MQLPPLYDDLTFLSPLSEQRADRLVQWLADGLAGGGRVLDAGCGWGELLLRVLAAEPAAYGTGVDLDQDRIEEGQRRATARGLADRVMLTAGDASATQGDLDGLDGLVAIGASQVWAAESAEPGPLDYGSALRAIRSGVRRGGRVVYGEGIWSRPPTPEAVAPLSGRDDELLLLPDLVDLAVEHGFAIVAVQEASQEEWDEFESGFTARYASWLAEHPSDHPDAAEVRAAAAGQRAAYLRGYRGVMGLAYLQLVAV